MEERVETEEKYFIGDRVTGVFRPATKEEQAQTLAEKVLEGHMDPKDIPTGGTRWLGRG